MPNASTSRAQQVRLIHLALCTGTVLAGIVMVVMRSRMTTEPPANSTLGLALGGVAVLCIVIALAQLRGRIAARRSDQSSEDYWSDVATNTNALLLWGVLEGAGFAGIMGYNLSGSAIPLGVAVIAVIVLFLMRPATLEG